MYKTTNKKLTRTIMIIAVALILINFTIPNFAFADTTVENVSIKECIEAMIKLGETEGIWKMKITDKLVEGKGYSSTEADNIYSEYYDNSNVVSVTYSMSDTGGYQLQEVNINKNEIESFINSNKTADEKDEDDADGGGLLLEPISALLVAICDGINSILQYSIIGDLHVTARGQKAKNYMEDTNKASLDDVLPVVSIKRSAIEPTVGYYRIGTIKLTPAEIFAGNVAALNANFFSSETDYSGMLGGEDKSIVLSLKGIVSAWYVAIRNITIVGLLSVLLYLGIRIIIGSSAGDKAKYKQTFMDWVVALCLIFFLHYIMAFTMTIADQVTSVLAGTENQDGTINQVVISLTDDDGNAIENRTFYSNFINVARTKTQYDNFTGKVGYTVMYIAFTAYTVYFVIIYLKRVLMLAFYTLMAPAVALSYPLDKLKDGKAQAFNFWLKDYIFYAFLPALHMILYTVFISSALSLASKNMLYALVAMAFIVPAEKIVKKMFGIHGNTEERAGGFAGGAVAGTLMSSLRKIPKGGKGSNQSAGGKQRTSTVAHNPNSINFMDTMNALDGQKASARQTQQQSSQQQQTQQAAEQNKKQEQEKGARNQDPEYARELENAYMEKHPDEQTEGQTVPGTENNGNNDDNNFETRLDLPPEMSNPEPKIHNEEPQEKRRLLNNFSKAVNRRMILAGGGKGIAKKLGKSAIKGLGTAAGMTALGMAGLGIGMVGGDLGDAVKGLSVGAAAGGFLGSRATDAVGNALSGNGTLGSFASEVMYGGVEESNNHRAREAYVSNRSVRESILNDHPEFNAEQIGEYAKRRYDMMYESGNDDEKLADKAIKLEDALVAQGQSEYQAHRSAAGALGAVSKYSFSDLADESKRQKYEKQVSDRVMEESNGNITQEVAEERARSYFDNMAVLRGVQSAPKAPKTSKTTKTTKGTNKINRTDKK